MCPVVLAFPSDQRTADLGIRPPVCPESTLSCGTQDAAPERWRNERATTATDVYSFGIIAYELLSGDLPFSGADIHHFREQHLHADPAQLALVPAAFGALVEECLYKAAEARPSPSNIVARLARVAQTAPSAGLAKLEEANRAEAVRRGVSGRRESEFRSEAERRAVLLDAATKGLARIQDILKEAITQAAPSARLATGRSGGRTIRLNQAEIEFAPSTATSASPWGSWTPPAFDVVAHAVVGVEIPVDRQDYEGRVHSLWYCDAQKKGRYQWFETAFMVSPLIPRRGRKNPFALNPGEESAKAVWRGMAEWQVAWPFTPLNVGDLDEFVNRWAGWFADAAQGRRSPRATQPSQLDAGTFTSRELAAELTNATQTPARLPSSSPPTSTSEDCYPGAAHRTETKQLKMLPWSHRPGADVLTNRVTSARCCSVRLSP